MRRHCLSSTAFALWSARRISSVHHSSRTLHHRVGDQLPSTTANSVVSPVPVWVHEAAKHAASSLHPWRCVICHACVSDSGRCFPARGRSYYCRLGSGFSPSHHPHKPTFLRGWPVWAAPYLWDPRTSSQPVSHSQATSSRPLANCQQWSHLSCFCRVCSNLLHRHLHRFYYRRCNARGTASPHRDSADPAAASVAQHTWRDLLWKWQARSVWTSFSEISPRKASPAHRSSCSYHRSRFSIQCLGSKPL